MSYEYQRTTTATRREERFLGMNYLHISCEARMVVNPLTLKDGVVRPDIPWIGTGTTYDVGRNKAKREKRRLA